MKLLSASTFSGGGLIPAAELITLRNRNGLVAQFTDYGARWVSMWVPDREGRLSDIVLGFDTIDGYRTAGRDTTVLSSVVSADGSVMPVSG